MSEREGKEWAVPNSIVVSPLAGRNAIQYAQPPKLPTGGCWLFSPHLFFTAPLGSGHPNNSLVRPGPCSLPYIPKVGWSWALGHLGFSCFSPYPSVFCSSSSPLPGLRQLNIPSHPCQKRGNRQLIIYYFIKFSSLSPSLSPFCFGRPRLLGIKF
jgi:hypothetical protein